MTAPIPEAGEAAMLLGLAGRAAWPLLLARSGPVLGGVAAMARAAATARLALLSRGQPGRATPRGGSPGPDGR